MNIYYTKINLSYPKIIISYPKIILSYLKIIVRGVLLGELRELASNRVKQHFMMVHT